MKFEGIKEKYMNIKMYDAIVIGSGAAGLNAADTLYENGMTNIAIITEGLYTSTSINTGSDKQTYYKLSTTGGVPDSVLDMAKTYYNCGGMQGYHALKESALSLRCFFKLVEAGVPFPMNEYGEYVGYRTDHDERVRASSCGPLTSKYMCEALIKRVEAKNIDILEPMRVVKLLADENGVYGCVAINAETAELSVYASSNIIMATGGPAGIYASSVYPKSHVGGIGVALNEGAKASSLCEWQYGLASTDFRWNLSGSYQQVIPKYISVDNDGKVHEFLKDYIDGNECDLIFLKGYNWPFAPKNLKGANTSSMVDIAVYYETAVLGRKVFLDFRSNPSCYDVKTLSKEAREYLENCGIDGLETPIERLKAMNMRAYQLYLDNGIDLEKEPLAMDVCAQHCNGGLTVDVNYMTTIDGLYAAGECAGVFGVTRPGGSALNSTQVSSLSAALDIVRKKRNTDTAKAEKLAEKALPELEAEKKAYQNGGNKKPMEERLEFSTAMSRDGAFIRNGERVKALQILTDGFSDFHADTVKAETPYDIYRAFVNKDLLETMKAVLSSIHGFCETIGKSRGGFLVSDSENPMDAAKNSELYSDNSEIITVKKENGKYSYKKEKVSPIPQSEQWFEKVLSAQK